MSISAQALLDQAVEETGLSDFGDDWFRGPLEAYVSDLGARHLSDWGNAFLTRLVRKDLVRRLQIIDCLKRHCAGRTWSTCTGLTPTIRRSASGVLWTAPACWAWR